MDEKRNEFNEIAEQLDKISNPTFALWYMLQDFEKIVDRMIKDSKCEDKILMNMAMMKYGELKKAAEQMRDVLADDLW